jgi:hypothetical protein
VDGVPASIAVNLSFYEHLLELTDDTLYVVQIFMNDPGADATGDPSEAHYLHAAEKKLVYPAWHQQLKYIGRVRNNGCWELIFMGRSGLAPQLVQLCEERLAEAGRGFSVIEKPDPDWSFYNSFLYPDLEQLQWMKDRRVVDALQSRGDNLTTPRRVDHVVTFQDEPSRDAFRLHVETLGFGSLRGNSSSLQVFRTDSVQLDDIHQLSVYLSDLAAHYRGEYLGWVTRLVKPPIERGALNSLIDLGKEVSARFVAGFASLENSAVKSVLRVKGGGGDPLKKAVVETSSYRVRQAWELLRRGNSRG